MSWREGWSAATPRAAPRRRGSRRSWEHSPNPGRPRDRLQFLQQLNFNHIYNFHVIATEGSLKGAAQKLNLSQSTLSTQLKRAEEALGQPLFDRRPGGGLVLNEAGRRAYAHTSAMFAAGSRLAEEFGAAAPKPPTLRLAVLPSVARSVTADFLLAAFDFDSGPRIAIHHADYPELFYALQSEDVDAALADGPPPQPLVSAGIAHQVVYEPDLVAVAGGDLAEQIQRFPDDLHRAPFFHYTPATQQYWEIERFFRDRGLQPDVLGETDDVQLMAEAARRGVGVVLVPRLLVRRDLREGRLEELGTLRGRTSPVCALYREQPASKQVLEAILRLKSWNEDFADGESPVR